MIDPRIEADTPYSDEVIRSLIAVLGTELPSDYRDFVQRYGGAFVGGEVQASDGLSVLRFFPAGGDSGVLATLHRYNDLLEIGALPIADDALGNLFVLDRDGGVQFINYYGGRTSASKVSDTFAGFLARIVVRDEA